MKFELSHYSDSEVVALRPRNRVARADNFKPVGLWVSVDGDWGWREWCLAEEYALGRIRHRVTLREDHGVLVLWSPTSLDAFTEQYRVRRGRYAGEPEQFWPIDWTRVAADYAGILIPEYHWSRRMDLWWYYPWDCASGCIWDVERAIESIEPVECVLEGVTTEEHAARMKENLEKFKKPLLSNGVA